MVEISRRALRRMDPDDAALLSPLADVANGGVSPAERLLEAHARGATRSELLDLASL
jgi:glutamate--cysteine ligase